MFYFQKFAAERNVCNVESPLGIRTARIQGIL